MNGQSVSIHPFPVPGHPDPVRYGEPKRAVLDLMDSEVRKGEIMTMQMGYYAKVPVEFPESQ